MDALDDNVCVRILGFVRTPRDAVRLAAASKRMRRLEPSVRRYALMLVAAGDAEALGWLRARACRVARVHIDCAGAPMAQLRAAHTLASAMPCANTLLSMGSAPFRDILQTLSRDGAAMTALLKRHVVARLGGATRDGVSDLGRKMLDKYGYDTDHDAFARASFAWSCNNPISAGVNGQLHLDLHMWQSADTSFCEMHIDVHRCSNGYLLDRSMRIIGDENTTDWWLEAATLYLDVQKYELWPMEEDDNSEFEDEFEDDSEDKSDDEAEDEAEDKSEEV